jgi:hypothetical protein
MLGSAVLDVAIGTIFVYLLLSLICSAVNEFIEAGLKNRAKDLERGIRNLLADDALAAKFYEHPLIKGLFCVNKGKPSYVPSRSFALTLLNIVAPEGLSIPDTSKTPLGPGSNSLQALRERISKLPKGDVAAPIQQALIAFIDDAQGDANRLRANVEDWYNASMDRVAGWYKRRVQVIILILGLGVAVALNADTSYIARRLANDSSLRSSLVSASQVSLQKGINEAGGTSSDTASAKERLVDNLAEIKKLSLPIGWNYEADDEHLKWPGLRIWQGDVLQAWVGQVQFHWLGWLVTAVAISLGAPFWFDLLNKFIVVRSTVKPHEKSQEEDSKD